MMKRFARRGLWILSVSALIGNLFSLPASAQDDYGWSGTNRDKDTLTFELWEDVRSQATHINRAPNMGRTGTGNYDGSRLCPSITKGPCATALASTKDGFEGTFVAPVCEKRSDENCIEWISIHPVDQPASPATLIRSIEGGKTPQIAKYGLPKGGTTSLWSQPGQTHKGADTTYAATLRMEVNLDRSSSRPHAFFSLDSYNLQVKPYQEITGPYEPHSCDEYKNGSQTIVGCGGLPEECAWTGNGICGKEVGFPEGSKVTVSFRIDSKTTGWFAGRVQDPNISIKKISAKQLRIQISGQPSSVPVARGHMPTAKASKKIIDGLRSCLASNKNNSCWTGLYAASDWGMDYVEAFRREFADTATYTRDVWSMRTVNSGSLGPCAAGESRLIGVVSTNSMAYQAEPPQFKNGFINYQVAGMHRLPDGKELALGRYDLVIRSDFARCLYRLSRLPISASISVVNDKGKKTFATTTVQDKNGWLKLSAQNFTFSKKTIKVKITKAKKK
jgi:hypothetical protein